MITVITIVVSDLGADEETDPLTTAVSNLEYDGYTIMLSMSKVADNV